MLQSSPQGIPGPRKWLETAGPCNEFLLALGQSKSNQPCSDSQNRWIPSVCSPLLHTPRANTGLGRSSRDTHIYLKGHKSQNYSYNKLHTFPPTLFSSRAKELSPLKIHTRNLTCSSDLANWARECWVEELSSAYCLGSVADPFCPRYISSHSLVSSLCGPHNQTATQSRAQQAATLSSLFKEQGQLLAVNRFSSVETGSCLSFKFQQQTQDCQHVLYSCCSA